MVADWICCGQTVVGQNQTVDNPTPNANGLVGQVQSLPYVVPSGFRLALTGLWAEAYNASGNVGLIVWVGAGQFTESTQGVVTCNSTAGTNFVQGLRIVFPAGSVLNARFTNNQPTGATGTFSWGMIGCIEEE